MFSPQKFPIFSPSLNCSPICILVSWSTDFYYTRTRCQPPDCWTSSFNIPPRRFDRFSQSFSKGEISHSLSQRENPARPISDVTIACRHRRLNLPTILSSLRRDRRKRKLSLRFYEPSRLSAPYDEILRYVLATRAVACDALHASSSRGHAAVIAAAGERGRRRRRRRRETRGPPIDSRESVRSPTASRFDAFRCPRDVQPRTEAAKAAVVENVRCRAGLSVQGVHDDGGCPRDVPECDENCANVSFTRFFRGDFLFIPRTRNIYYLRCELANFNNRCFILEYLCDIGLNSVSNWSEELN